MGDNGKEITVKVTNAVETYSVSNIINDMNTIISSGVIMTAQGNKPIARKAARFISPRVINIAVQDN